MVFLIILFFVFIYVNNKFRTKFFVFNKSVSFNAQHSFSNVHVMFTLPEHSRQTAYLKTHLNTSPNNKVFRLPGQISNGVKFCSV